MNKKQLINYLLNYDLQYRETVTFPTDITFGTEMEVLTRHLFRPTRFCSYMHNSQRKSEILDTDYLIAPENYDDIVLGGELISPVLRNTKEDWLNFRLAINDFVKYTGDSQITYHTSGHIHMGRDTLKDGDLVRLVKLYAAYEDIIFRFAAGEFLNIRAGATSYARSIAKKIKGQHFTSDEEVILALCFLENFRTPNVPFKYHGLNLSNLVSGNDTLEFRIPNGTLSPIIWQNNINFFAHLLMNLNNYDEELIDHYLSKLELPFSERDIIKYYNSILNFDKALELSNLIFDEEIDKLYFLRQYLKDGTVASDDILSSYQIEKAKSFVR